MKLFKAPYVVQKEILDNMQTSDLFWLSFVSKKIKNVIKSSQATRFKSIRSIVYDYVDQDQRIIYIPSESGRDVIMVTFVIYKGKENHFLLNKYDKKIDFKCLSCDCPSIMSFNFCNKESVYKSIHYNFLDFFGDCVEYQWILNRYTYFFPQVKKLSLVLDFWRYEDNKAAKQELENVLSSSPLMTHIKLSYLGSAETLSPDSKFYQAGSVEIRQGNHIFPANLRHFQGRQAFLRCNICETSHLIELINRWKYGQAFQKLEYLKIIIDSHHVPENQVLNAIGIKYIDATKKPPAHTLPKLYFDFRFKPNTDPIISHSYVVRKTDNRVASVSIHRNELSFGVWDKTEEEFLSTL
ncbi:unnamed protein product [Caenorhabditis nigoni]